MGNILINTSYANYASPVSNVTIRIIDENGIENIYSAENGKSLPLQVTEGNYSITVSAEGFFDKVFENLIVYQDNTTIVNAILFPIYNLRLENRL